MTPESQAKSKKVLFTSHTANFSKFNRPFMRLFRGLGYEVHYASAGEEEVYDCDKHHTVYFDRTPWSPRNITAYLQLKKILDNENYSIIHTHTPMGSVVTRLAARKARKNGTKVIYTAHGFHFYSGAPLVNWLIYYPVEKILANSADVLVTINSEDLARATASFKTKQIEKIDGVGVNLERFKPTTPQRKSALRKAYGYGKDDFIVLCVAEFTTNKGHEFLVEALRSLTRKIPNLKLLLAGDGYRLQATKNLVKKLRMSKYVDFMGYRQDIDKLYALSDVVVSASAREGLPVSIIEAMATGLPVVATRIRGHIDLVTEERNGLLYISGNAEELRDRLVELYENPDLRKKIAKSNVEDVARYSLGQALTNMAAIYGGM